MSPTGRLVGCALVVLALAQASEAHKPTTTEFTYHGDIYPIFAAKCGSCHRAGGVAPMSLLTYQEAYPWAVSIKSEILNLAMPPWFADERFGHFEGEGGLTAREIDTIVDWCLGGTPEGEPGVAQTTGGEVTDWSLGPPDLTLSMSEAFTLDADANEAVHHTVLAPELSSERHLRAVDFRPGSPNIVRSAMVYRSARPELSEPEQDELLAVWIPGEAPRALPAERGRRLLPGDRLVLRLHYKKTWLDEGSEVFDRSRVGLYFHEVEPEDIVKTIAFGVEASARTLPREVELLALLPRVGAPAESFLAEAVHPDGSREALIRLYHPDPDWPRKFWLRSAVVLPQGSRIELTVPGAEARAMLLLDVVFPAEQR